MTNESAIQSARLLLVRAAATQHREWERALERAMLAAQASGCSLRAMAAAAQIPHTTVADTLRRLAADE